MKLVDILYEYSNDQLKGLARLCGCGSITRKADRVECIRQALLNPASLRALWEKMDNLSRRAVASAYHNGGEFNSAAFVAQYGSMPPRPQKGVAGWFYPEPIILDLFIHNAPGPQRYTFTARIPEDMMPLLAELVPPAEKFQVTGQPAAPESLTGPHGEPIELMRAETEQAGLHDLRAYLRLVDRGEIRPSSSARLTATGAKKILDNLMLPDFLPLPEPYRAHQTIRPFGLDTFAREAGLVRYQSTTGLSLTDRGRTFYQSGNPEILLDAFETWTGQGEFDELSRISALKGQKSRNTYLTDPASRREAVVEALSWCPAGVWIDIEEFYRALKIWHFDFEVETTIYSNLYVGHPEYGALHGPAYWALVKGLYINCLLWEYMGVIGALDLIYTHPEEAYFEANLPYYDEYSFSLYDGLKYFRINNLGAFLLGQAAEYTPAYPVDKPLFSLSENLALTVTGPELTPNEQHLLRQLAVPVEGRQYRLDLDQALTALESGIDWQELADFLTKRHAGPLPEAARAWLEQVDQRRQAFQEAGPALLVRVNSPDLADLVLADPVLQKFCGALDRKTLVIPAQKEKVLRSRLKELGYVLLNK